MTVASPYTSMYIEYDKISRYCAWAPFYITLVAKVASAHANRIWSGTYIRDNTVFILEITYFIQLHVLVFRFKVRPPQPIHRLPLQSSVYRCPAYDSLPNDCNRGSWERVSILGAAAMALRAACSEKINTRLLLSNF